MSATPGPVSFRVSSQERGLLELLASARGDSLSSMARKMVMDMALAAVERAGGVEEIVAQAKRRQREEAEAAEQEVEHWATLSSALPLVPANAPRRD